MGTTFNSRGEPRLLHWRGSYWLSTLQTRWALLTILNQRLAEPRDGGEGTSTGITRVTGSGSLLSARLATSREERDQHSSHPWEPLWMITILLQDLLTTPTWLSWCRTIRPPLLCTMCTSKIRHNVHSVRSCAQCPPVKSELRPLL